ncbi:MAG: hypothetical protein WAQ28_08955 [Bacteroidia bacterium]
MSYAKTILYLKMAEETLYTPNTGMVTISTANSNRDGTGTLGSVITGADNGTIIKSVIIKAQTNTTQGSIRFFIDTGVGNAKLITEIRIPAITKSARNKSFETIIALDLVLQSGQILKASTQNAETFNIIAIGLDTSYSTTSLQDSTQFAIQGNVDRISVANPNLNGTGTLVDIIVPSGGSEYVGATIQRFFIKALATTTPGMIRLYLRDSAGTLTLLFTEIPVPAITPTATALSFSAIVKYNDFYLPLNYRILASTEKAETFVITAEALKIAYIK